jgi:hypothetical protein
MTRGRRRAATIGALGACVAVVASCGSGAGRPSPAPDQSRAVLGARYLAIAQPANHRLDLDFDGLDDHDHTNLGVAAADLRDAAATERQFDRRLRRLPLPAAIQPAARRLVTANESRARLSDQAAGSVSLAELRQYEPRLTAANAPVEAAVRRIRRELGLPPPSTS